MGQDVAEAVVSVVEQPVHDGNERNRWEVIFHLFGEPPVVQAVVDAPQGAY